MKQPHYGRLSLPAFFQGHSCPKWPNRRVKKMGQAPGLQTPTLKGQAATTYPALVGFLLLLFQLVLLELLGEVGRLGHMSRVFLLPAVPRSCGTKEATHLTNLPTRDPRPTPTQAQGLPGFLAKRVSTLTAIPITPPSLQKQHRDSSQLLGVMGSRRVAAASCPPVITRLQLNVSST